MASETLSSDDVSLLEGIPSLCPSPHSPSPSGGEDDEEEEEENNDDDKVYSEPDTPTPLASAYEDSLASAYPTSPSSYTSNIDIPKTAALPEVSAIKSSREYSSSLPDFRPDRFKYVADIDIEESKDSLPVGYKEKESLNDSSRVELGHNMSDVCCESVLWLAGRLGPVLTARHVTRNLLRMLTLCYLPDSGALAPLPPDPEDEVSVTRKRILGDLYAEKVLVCLSEIACKYEKLHFIKRMLEYVTMCKL